MVTFCVLMFFLRLGVVFVCVMESIAAEEINSPADVENLDAITIESEALDSEDMHRKSTLTGRKLRNRLRSNLGETLEKEMGLSNASFGPSVGVPVIRGLSGSRVLVAQDGLGSHDASNISPDHANTVEALLTDEIRIEKGPSVIRYGGTALGGVVNLVDYRIAEYLPEQPLNLSSEYRYNTNSDEHTGLFKLNKAFDDFFIVHVDGLIRSREQVEIPGFAMDEDAVFEQFGLNATGNTEGFIGNSNANTRTGAVGFSFVDEVMGFFGASVSAYESNYGIPPGGHPTHTHNNVPVSGEGEQVRIDMENIRYELKGEWFTDVAVLESMRLHAIIVDYTHDELEAGGVTTFDNFAREIRYEMDLRQTDYLNSTAGVQFSLQDFSAIGSENFIPESEISRKAAYWMQKLVWGDIEFEGGVRFEQQRIQPQQTERVIGGLVSATLPGLLEHDAWSFSLTGLYQVTDAASISLHWQYAQRPPAVQEVLSLGPHLATRSFDVGNIALEMENSNALELSFDYHSDVVKARLNVFKNNINNYIYQENQGFFFDVDEQLFRIQCVQLEQCVPVLGYQQQDVRFLGYEAEIEFSADIEEYGQFILGVFGDYTRAYFRTEGAGDVPRQPPRRAGAFISAQQDFWYAVVRWTHAWAQHRPGNNETRTPGYNLLDASLELQASKTDFGKARLFVNASNLLDEDIRQSVSFLRSFAPQIGRNFEIGIALDF